MISNSQRIPGRDDQIAADKIRLVFQHAPLAIAVNPIIGILVVVIDWSYIHILSYGSGSPVCSLPLCCVRRSGINIVNISRLFLSLENGENCLLSE